MKYVWFAVWMALCASPAWAAQAVQPLDEEGVQAARARIDAEREEKNAIFAAQDEACLSRFAVTDCQNDVTKRWRAALAGLKRQESVLNTAVRQQRAQEQVKRTQEKADARAAGDASTGAGAPQDREMGLQEKMRNHPKPAASDARRAKAVPVVDTKAQEDKRKAYADKQQELVKKRQERDKHLQEQGPAKTGLPTPP